MGLLIDVVSFFIIDVLMLGVLCNQEWECFKVKGLDKGCSVISWMKSFFENMEVCYIFIYNGGDQLFDNQIIGMFFFEMNQLFICLLEELMQFCLYDERVGYFFI